MFFFAFLIRIIDFTIDFSIEQNYFLMPKRSFQEIINGYPSQESFTKQLCLTEYNEKVFTPQDPEQIKKKLNNIYKAIPLLAPHYTQFYGAQVLNQAIDAIFSDQSPSLQKPQDTQATCSDHSSTYSIMFKNITKCTKD